MKRDSGRGKGEPSNPSSTLGYFVREAVRMTWVSKRNSLVAIVMIATSLFIVGVFLLISENLGRAVTLWGGQSHFTVYLREAVTPFEARKVDEFLGSNPAFTVRKYVSPKDALRKFRSIFGSLTPVINELEKNPFPGSFEVEVSTQTIESVSFRTSMETIRSMPGVDHVQFDWEWVTRLRKVIRVINSIGLVTGGIVALAAAFMIANVIRLTMIIYREEIEIMRLVGATETMIRGPFLAEGLLQGTLGGVLGVGMLFVLFTATQRLMTPANPILWDFLLATFLPWRILLSLVGGGVLAGLFGSWLSLRERTEDGRL